MSVAKVEISTPQIKTKVRYDNLLHKQAYSDEGGLYLKLWSCDLDVFQDVSLDNMFELTDNPAPDAMVTPVDLTIKLEVG